MHRVLALFVLCLLITPALAQEDDDLVRAIQSVPDAATGTATDQGTAGAEIPPPPENPDLNLKDEKTREFEDAPILRLRILDKVTAASRTYELNVGRTVAYGNLRIRPRACRKSSPLDDPESAAFLQIWEVKPDQSSAWVFSGWMFASSPSISSMDHPVYDVTVLECKFPDGQDPYTKQEEQAAQQSDDSADDSDADALMQEDLEDALGPDQDSSTTGAADPTKDTPATDNAAASSE